MAFVCHPDTYVEVQKFTVPEKDATPERMASFVGVTVYQTPDMPTDKFARVHEDQVPFLISLLETLSLEDALKILRGEKL